MMYSQNNNNLLLLKAIHRWKSYYYLSKILNKIHAYLSKGGIKSTKNSSIAILKIGEPSSI